MLNFREISARLAFPLVMGGGIYATFYFMHLKGVAINAVTFPVVIIALLLIALLERVIPFRSGWNNNDGDVSNDAINLVITQTIIPRLFTPFGYIILATVTAWLAAQMGNQLWPHHWHLIAQLFLALLIAEFGRYWVHRWAHTVPFLWRFHAIHHSPNRLYFLNAARFHPVEKIFFLLPETVPFILLGTNPETLGLYAVFNSIHGLFQHSNIYLKLGWLNYIFSMAELHRFHHSKIIDESNKNYGNNLIFWDIIFGTFFYPKEREVSTIGLYNPAYPKDYIGQLKAPFQGEVDKPADFYEREEYYHNLVKNEK